MLIYLVILWTFMVYIILSDVYCAGRSIFLALVGLDWCDVLSGEINESKCSTTERDMFYVLDQVPILAFFAIYALLVQFWAEVYYNAVDKLLTLTAIVKPVIRCFIVVRREITPIRG